MPGIGIGIGIGMGMMRSVQMAAQQMIKRADYGAGAAVAFSLDSVSDTYSGDLLLVRRSSDNAQQGFPKDQITDGTLVAFVGAGNDGHVVTWYGQRGGINASQGTATRQPKIVEAGVLVTKGGKPGVRFTDPATGSLGPALEFDPFHVASTQHVWLFSVYSLSISGNSPYILGSRPGDRGLLSLHLSGDRRIRLATVRQNGTKVYNGSTMMTLDQQYLRVDRANRSTLDSWLNSNAEISGQLDNNTDFNMPTKYQIGNTENPAVVNDYILQELIAFNSDMSADRAAIEENINQHYTIY